eukprot:gene933-1260_t
MTDLSLARGGRAAKHFPGVPMLPTMTNGATDGRFLTAAGIPTYGVPGRFFAPDGNGVHGLNERKPTPTRSKTATDYRSFDGARFRGRLPAGRKRLAVTRWPHERRAMGELAGGALEPENIPDLDQIAGGAIAILGRETIDVLHRRADQIGHRPRRERAILPRQNVAQHTIDGVCRDSPVFIGFCAGITQRRIVMW